MPIVTFAAILLWAESAGMLVSYCARAEQSRQFMQLVNLNHINQTIISCSSLNMSLYDDIISKQDASSDEWLSKKSSIKLLQDHLQVKRTTQNLNKSNQTVGANSRKLPQQILLKSTPSNIDERPSSPVLGSVNFPISKDSSLLGGDWDVNDEYDPRWPNDYEKIAQEKAEARDREIELKRSKRESSSKYQITATRSLGLDYGDEDEEDDDKPEDKTKSRACASFAPPPVLLEDVEKVTASVGFGISSVAAKIMAKMGYKEGQGLGKEEQGINKALQVEKIGKAHGKIVIENEVIKPNEENSITEMLKSPSKVVLLRNMVGPGEVDEELEPETKEECSKYGEVSRCVIFEQKEYDSDEDAVRIFIEFVRVESAIKALIDLNGRYFGGRIVKASFYDWDRFKRNDFRV